MANQMADTVLLNVGGHSYTTKLSTLKKYPDSELGTRFSKLTPSTTDANGPFFIDADGLLFRYVLNFLRRGKLSLPEDFKDWELLEADADYYDIKELKNLVAKLKENNSKTSKASKPSAASGIVSDVLKCAIEVGLPALSECVMESDSMCDVSPCAKKLVNGTVKMGAQMFVKHIL